MTKEKCLWLISDGGSDTIDVGAKLIVWCLLHRWVGGTPLCSAASIVRLDLDFSGIQEEKQ
jgi:hypothetical protein